MKKLSGAFAAFGIALVVMSFVGPDALAQAAPEVVGPAPVSSADQPPSFFGSLFQLLPMLVICYVIFYMMVVKPQEKKVKSHKDLMENLKRGDLLSTSGGIVGKFAGLEKDLVLLEIASNVRIRVEPGHITKRIDQKSEAQAA